MGAIGGIIHPDGDSYAAFLDVMLRRLAHRGAAGSGTWRGERCLLGQNRFVIGGGGADGRPAANERETIWVVLSGEIYNSHELRAGLIAKGHTVHGTSDAEILPHLYEEWGDGFVERLRGMFALALWDSERRRIILARDRAGEKPLFYAPIPGGLAFASEMKGLFAVPGVDMDVRPQAIHDFLSFGVVPGEETVYAGIRRVPPAHMVIADADGATFARPYWRLGFTPKRRIGREEALEEVLRLAREAVMLRSSGTAPVACFPPGEIESALVAALAPAGSENTLVADAVEPDIEDIIETIAHFDEPYSDMSAVPAFAAARQASRDFRVALSGAGGAELFAGSDRYVTARTTRRLRLAGLDIARPAFSVLARFLPAPAGGHPAYSSVHRFIRMMGSRENAQYLLLTGDRLSEAEKAQLCGGADFRSSLRLMERLNREFPGLGPLNSLFARDFSRLLGESRLVGLDMAGMAATLRIRSPFLDHALIEFVTTLPENHRPPGRGSGSLLHAMADRLLPHGITGESMRGSKAPGRRWMTERLWRRMGERVLDPGSYAMGHFDRGRVESLVLGDNAGWEPGRRMQTVWGLFCLEIWWDQHRGGARAATPRKGDPGAAIDAAA